MLIFRKLDDGEADTGGTDCAGDAEDGACYVENGLELVSIHWGSPLRLEELCDLAAAVTHQVLCEAGDAVLYRLVGDLERGFVLDLVSGERVMQGDAAINRAGDVDVHAVLEQLVFVQVGPQVRSDDEPAVPADAGGFQALVRVSDEFGPEVGVCRLDVFGCGSAHGAGNVAGGQLGVDFLTCPAVERGRLLAAEARVSVVDGDVPCPPDGAGVLEGERFGGG